MSAKVKPVLVGMVSTPMTKLVARDFDTPEIMVTIAELRSDDKGTYPVNWHRDFSTPMGSTGGCFARVFASTPYPASPSHGISSWYGPAISYGNLLDYSHAYRAVVRIGKKQDAIYKARGGSKDSAEEMGRFLEAAGIREVWVAQDRHSSLSHVDWQRMDIGRFVHELRANLPETPAQLVAEEVAS